MDRDGGSGSEMQEASESHGRETEPLIIKTGDAASSMGRINAPNSHRVIDPLLKACFNGQLHALMNYGFNLISVFQYPNLNHVSAFKILKGDFLVTATHRTATLGVFEILRNKLRNNNDGKPLSLYQEACCGLTSGAVGAFAIRPLMLALDRVGLQSLTYSNWFASLSHIFKKEGALAFWRGSGWSMAAQATAQMGLLPSYFLSQNYLIESKGLSEWNAQTCAIIISGFFASVFSHPLCYADAINSTLKQHRNRNKNIRRLIPACVCIILTPYSGAQFYMNFLKRFRRNVLFCAMHWLIYEDIRKAYSSSSSSSRDLIG